MQFYKNPFFESLENTNAGAVVFSDGDETVTCGEILQQSKSIAAGLHSQGFQIGDRAILLVPPGKEFLSLFFAVGLLQGTIAIIDPEMGRDNFEAKIQQLHAKWIFIDSRLVLLREHPIIRYFYLKFAKKPFYISLPTDATIISTGKRLPLFTPKIHVTQLSKSRTEQIDYHTAENHDLIITYTSGTLAEPKGVVHSVNSLYESLSQIKNQLGSNPQSRIGAYLPHFLLIGICSGFPVFLFPKDNPPEWKYNFFRENIITTLFGPPSDFLPLIKHCQKEGIQLPESLTLILLGSAPVYPAFLEELYSVCKSNVVIKCLYGMTENLVVAVADGKAKLASQHPGDYLGETVSGIQLALGSDDEILLNSPQLFTRYLHEASRISPHPSGDVGYLAEDGSLILTGRKKDMIIRRDTNIYPAIYEKTIRSIPGVREAVLIGNYRDDLHDEEVVLFVESDSVDEKKLMAQLTSGKFSIDKEALPDRIIFSKIPRSGRQDKIDRKVLRAMLR